MRGAIIKKELDLHASLHTLLQILSLTLLEKMPLQQAPAELTELSSSPEPADQLNLCGS